MNGTRGVLWAGARGLFDGRLWLELMRAVFSLAVLARLIGVLALGLVGTWFAAMLPLPLRSLPTFVAAVWLTPLFMRRASATIARRAVEAAPGAMSMAARPLPSTGTYRAWWLPLILCDTILPPLLDWLNVADSGIVSLVALLAIAAAAPGAIVRSVLAPWFAVAQIDRALAARRGFWAIVALAWILVLALLQWLAGALTGLGAAAAFFAAIMGADLRLLVSVVLLRGVIACAAFVAVGIFCTSALTWFAAMALAPGDVRPPGTAAEPEAESEAAAAGQPAEPPRAAETKDAVAATRRAWADVLVARAVPARTRRPPPPPAPRPARRPPSPEQVKAARTLARRQGAFVAVLVAGALYFAHDAIVPWFLGPQFREAIDRHGDWMDLGVRLQARTDMACLGRTKTLRVLSWVGVVGNGSPQNAALGCAAFHGHVDTVETLVALGEDIDRPVTATDALPAAAAQTPLQQAVRTPAGLPAAEWLLAHGAKPRPAAAAADPVQTAAAARCIDCLRWLQQHGLPMDGTSPATPLALWLDHRATPGEADVATIARLVALGLSPSAVGTDGRSALHAAAAAANGPVVEFLLAQGADPAVADRDGMTPLFYAAAAIGRDDHASPDVRDRRMAVVLRLIAATPSLAGQGVPAAQRHPVIDADPYIHQPYDFGATAALEPRIRAAAQDAGKAVHYTDGSFLTALSPADARALLARMDDADIARVMAPGTHLATFAGKVGWWPELLRAVRGWAPSRSDVDHRHHPDCEVLRHATDGPGDASPGRTDSWAVVDAWLDAGMRPGDCSAWTGSVPDAVARRSPAQQKDWAARSAGPSIDRSPRQLEAVGATVR